MMLCVFGDSIGFGVHLQERETLVYKLSEKFGIRTLNASVPGNTAKQGLMRIEQDVIRFRPDVCIVEFGMNDHYAVALNESNTPLADFGKSLVGIIRRLEQIQCVPILCTVQPVILGDDHAYYYNRHPRHWYQSPPGAQAWIDAYSNEVRAIARRERVRLADIALAFADYQAAGGNQAIGGNQAAGGSLFDVVRNLNNCGEDDGVHPTGQGVDLYVECISRHLHDFVGSGTRR